MHSRRSHPISPPLIANLMHPTPTAVLLIERMGLINCDTLKVLFKSEGLSTSAAVAFIRLSVRQVGHQSGGDATDGPLDYENHLLCEMRNSTKNFR